MKVYMSYSRLELEEDVPYAEGLNPIGIYANEEQARQASIENYFKFKKMETDTKMYNWEWCDDCFSATNNDVGYTYYWGVRGFIIE